MTQCSFSPQRCASVQPLPLSECHAGQRPCPQQLGCNLLHVHGSSNGGGGGFTHSRNHSHNTSSSSSRRARRGRAESGHAGSLALHRHSPALHPAGVLEPNLQHWGQARASRLVRSACQDKGASCNMHACTRGQCGGRSPPISPAAGGGGAWRVTQPRSNLSPRDPSTLPNLPNPPPPGPRQAPPRGSRAHRSVTAYRAGRGAALHLTRQLRSWPAWPSTPARQTRWERLF
jgi:hypothetical protein